MKISKKLTSFDLQQYVLQEPLLCKLRWKRKLLCFPFDALKKENINSILTPSTKEKRNYSNRIFLLLSASVKISSSTYDKKKNFNHWILCLVFLKNSQRRHVSFQRLKSYTVSLSILQKKSFHFNALPKKIPKKNSKGLKLKRES